MESYGQRSHKKNHILKIVILGDCSVGKTSIIQNYIRKNISQVYKPTIGADFHSKRLEIMDNDELKSVTLQIWDTAGQERFQSLGRAFYRGAEACILVYDITSSKSFENLNVWRQEFLMKALPKDPEAVPFFILGNKVDLEDQRQVSRSQVEEWLRAYPEVIHFETSALDGSNVIQAFNRIAQDFLKQQSMEESIKLPGSIGKESVGKKKFNLDSQTKKPQVKKKCCK
uniref:Ras-related protein Rab-7b n=1 Tax=Strombidium rassoulzadegani TaxID=1082188 RepID=A0A7S3FSY3_9SPIT|mmetsp:Transcript_12801/g.21666  ORF Transcript_12801/g.21666 Transcript_12801/m.21666 type:complete len:228 (+) Transcript_12801:1-684(+)